MKYHGKLLQMDDVSDYERQGMLYVPKASDSHYSSFLASWSTKSIYGMWGTDEATPAAKVVLDAQQDTEIVAWRCWKLDVPKWGTPVLRSLNRDTIWESAVLRADATPAPENQAGVYALAEQAALSGMLNDGYAYPAVYGTVALSGTVVEGSKGYRGECAVIRSLIVRRGTDCLSPLAIADALAERYGVDVTFDIDESVRDDDDEDDE